MKNPAKINPKGRTRQGRYEVENKSKYLGDPNSVIYRSSWERILCVKFDRSEDIIAWGMECVVIRYRSPKDGMMHRYFTDFLTIAINNEGEKVVTVIEVKPEKEKYPPKPQGKKKSRYLYECMTYEVNQAKWEAARHVCKQKGWNFVILSEKQILGK